MQDYPNFTQSPLRYLRIAGSDDVTMKTKDTTTSRHNIARSYSVLLVVIVIFLVFNSPLLLAQVTRGPIGNSSDQATQEVMLAGADELFLAELRFPETTHVGAIRSFGAQFRVPRILASVDHWYGNTKPVRGSLMIGLGEMYSSDEARQYTECKAMARIGHTTIDELRGVPIDEWRVQSIYINATAHIIRILINGEQLPKAELVTGGKTIPGELAGLENYTRREIATPIRFERVGDIPDYCVRYFAPLDAPILVGGFPREFEAVTPQSGEGFREYAFRVLARIPANTAVTIRLKLDSPATVDVLADLVEQYDVRGMSAEMVPEYSSKRVIVEAMLSSYAPSLGHQVHRAKCQYGLGGEEPQSSSEWFADWISISLRTEDAARFMTYPRIAHARIDGYFPAVQLERLKDFFESQHSKSFGMPTTMYIPPGCDDVFYHDENMQMGTIGVSGAPHQ